MRRGVALVSVVGCSLAGFALTLLAQVAQRPEIETVWPTSVVGWVGIVTAMLLLVDNIVGRIKRPADAAANRVDEHLSGDIKALGERLTTFARQGEAHLEDLRREIEREGKDCTERVGALAVRVSDAEKATQKLKEDMAQSREDRRHITQDIIAWKELIQEWRKEDRARDDAQLEMLTAVRLELQQARLLRA